MFWVGFFCKNDSLNPLRFSLARETDTKKAEQFFKNLFFYDKIDQNANFAKLPSFITTIQEWKFCKIAQLFIQSVSLARKNLRGLFLQKNLGSIKSV